MESQRDSEPHLTPEGGRKRKIERPIDYGLGKKDDGKQLLELEEELEQLKLDEAPEKVEEEKHCRQDMSKAKAKIDALAVQIAKRFVRTEIARRTEAGETLESVLQQLHVELEDSDENQLILKSSKSKGIMEDSSISEGTSVAENVNDFIVLKEYSILIQKILSKYPNTTSGFRVGRPSCKSLIMNTLAKVYEMARQERHTVYEIQYILVCIRDLEIVGLDVSWLKAMVVECRKEFEIRELEEKISNAKAKLQRLEEKESKKEELKVHNKYLVIYFVSTKD